MWHMTYATLSEIMVLSVQALSRIHALCDLHTLLLYLRLSPINLTLDCCTRTRKQPHQHGLVVGPGEGGPEHRTLHPRLFQTYVRLTFPQLFNRVLAPYVENLDMNQVNYGIGQGAFYPALRPTRSKPAH